MSDGGTAMEADATTADGTAQEVAEQGTSGAWQCQHCGTFDGFCHRPGPGGMGTLCNSTSVGGRTARSGWEGAGGGRVRGGWQRWCQSAFFSFGWVNCQPRGLDTTWMPPLLAGLALTVTLDHCCPACLLCVCLSLVLLVGGGAGADGCGGGAGCGIKWRDQQAHEQQQGASASGADASPEAAAAAASVAVAAQVPWECERCAVTHTPCKRNGPNGKKTLCNGTTMEVRGTGWGVGLLLLVFF